jgi:hypothetical protein
MAVNQIAGVVPPYTLSDRAVMLVANISESVGRLTVELGGFPLRLRRANRIRTIQGTLAIEGNTLSVEQITALLDGETVLAAKTGAQSRARSGGQSDSILAALADDPLSAADIAASLGLKTKTGSFKRALHALFEAGLIEQTLPDKPTSRLQKYSLTEAGKALLLEGKESA